MIEKRTAPRRGKPLSVVALANVRAAAQKPERRAKISNARRGKPVSEASRIGLENWRKNRV